MGSALDIEALYSLHRDGVLRFFARRTGDGEVALDLMAETFAAAVAGRRRFRGDSSQEAAGWLYGIARRLLADYHRRGCARDRALSRLRLERPERDPEILSEVEAVAALTELQAVLNRALDHLPASMCTAVRLRIVDGVSYADIARALQISQPAARARVSRGLTVLADTVDREATNEMRIHERS